MNLAITFSRNKTSPAFQFQARRTKNLFLPNKKKYNTILSSHPNSSSMLEHVKSHPGSIYPIATANKISQVFVAVHMEEGRWRGSFRVER